MESIVDNDKSNKDPQVLSSFESYLLKSFEKNWWKLGFGIYARPINSERNIYLFRDCMWNVLYKLFGPKKKC